MRIALGSLIIAGSIAVADAAPEFSNAKAKRSFAITGENLSSYEAPSNGGKQFTMSQMPSGHTRKPDAQAAFLRAHAKYGKTLPPELQKAMANNPDLDGKFKSFFPASGHVTTSTPALPAPYYDSEYVVAVEIGTPPQTTYLDLDTGSSDFWTFSTDTSPLAVDGHILYRPHNSSTSKLLPGETWSVLYGDGAGAGGIVYTDRVQLGELVAEKQAVQVAVQVSPEISSDSFSSGILGMASKGANTVRPTQQTTYLDNIKSDLSLPIFTADLQKGRPGSYDFGYINKSRFNDPLQFTPINRHSPFWEVRLEGYKIGRTGPYKTYTWDSIVDTGTSLLLAPVQILNDYYGNVKGAVFDDYLGMVIFPCDAYLPDFTFAIDSYRGKIPGSYINYSPANQTHCYGGIQSSAGIPFAVLGDILLKTQYVVFDAGAYMVGFANKDTV